MQGVTIYLFVAFIIASKLDATQENGSKAPNYNACNQLLMEKMDNISSSVRDPDNALVTQIFFLTNKLAIVETQLKEGQQATRDELQITKADLQKTKGELQKTKTYHKAELKETKAELQATKAEVASLRSRESNPGSSSFVHWGRKSCPGNTSMVYSGVAGGKHYKEKGDGTNRLCLTRQPEFDSNIVKPQFWGNVWGTEYEHIQQGHHDHDVPCSVCRAPASTTIMVPGTMTCPPAWTRQYRGHLVTGYHDHFASEYMCLDQEPEHDSSGVLNQDGNLIFYAMTVCGSLPCPPYVNEKVVTCVVCSI